MWTEFLLISDLGQHYFRARCRPLAELPEEFAVAPLEEKARNNFLPILYLSHLILSFLLFLQFPIVCSVCATTTTRERESGQASGPCNELTGAAGEQPGSRDIKGYDPRLPAHSGPFYRVTHLVGENHPLTQFRQLVGRYYSYLLPKQDGGTYQN